MLILAIAILIMAFLTLSCSGNTFTLVNQLRAEVHALRAEVEELGLDNADLYDRLDEVDESQKFQSRTTRRAIQQEIALVGEHGYKEPPKSDLEVAMDALSQGEEPVLNFGAIGRKS